MAAGTGFRVSVLPDRTFEAVVLDWDGTAVPDRAAEASEVRARIEALCGAGVHVAIVTGTHVGNIDGQLGARPSGPGRLRLCVNRGSEVFAVDGDGPHLVHRRTATADEDAALDRAASLTVEALGRRGLEARIVSQRLNRRKIDLIPLPEWADPPKAQIASLLRVVTARLAGSGITDLAEVVRIAADAGRRAGLADPRVTSDVKHVEIGLTDKSDSVRWLLDTFWTSGIGPGLVLIAGDEFGPLGGVPGSDALMRAPRATAISVGVEPGGVPDGVLHVGGGPDAFLAVLDDQLQRRAIGRVPSIDEDPAWTLELRFHPALRRVHESLLALADGRFGTRGCREEARGGAEPLVVASGVYRRTEGGVDLLPGPLWTMLEIPPAAQVGERRVLDLRTGVLLREHPEVPTRSIRFVSSVRPGVMAMSAEGSGELLAPGEALRPPPDGKAETGRTDGIVWAVCRSNLGSGIAAAAHQRQAAVNGTASIERIAAYTISADPGASIEALRDAGRDGIDRLLAESRERWAERWSDAEVRIDGDPDTELAVRFAIFHLLCSAAGGGEAAVGPRGLTGRAYGGHVFWDADVFVLPALAAIDPRSARAMLRYRTARLDAARRNAAGRGARFPWESAHDGTDVTPRSAIDPNGHVIPILTGEHEEHIVSDVAWAAVRYASWTGDETFLHGDGAELVIEGARYWASRVRYDASGCAHIDGVIGPDEYHEPVDDNAYTNVMARWTLRAAAALAGGGDEAGSWLRVASDLTDGYDARTGIYEQFAGFHGLEPLIISEIAAPPIAADVLLGRDRVRGTQVIKQPDVLMLHHLVPDEVAPGSLGPNLRHYGPRTSHGSSLSPAIHASLLARAGRPDEALHFLRIAARLDMDDLTGTTGGGLHIATMGGLWQALAHGFAGVQPSRGVLHVDPKLPASWRSLELRFRFRGARVTLRCGHDEVWVAADGDVTAALRGTDPAAVAPDGTTFRRRHETWTEATA